MNNDFMHNSFPSSFAAWLLSYVSIFIGFMLPSVSGVVENLAGIGSFFGGLAALLMAGFSIYKFFKNKKH